MAKERFNATHRLGGSPKEVPTTVPVLSFLDIHQADIGVMHQRRRLQRLARLLLSQSCGRQPPELVVDEWQRLFSRAGITMLDL